MNAMFGETSSLTRSLVLSLLCASAGAAHAAPTPVTQCGQVLDTPGDYRLTQDLGPCTGDGIVITADDVRLTLAGHTLSGVSTQESCDLNSPQYGIFIVGGTTGVRVGGGTVRGFVDGILQSGSSSAVTAMRVVDNCEWGVMVSGSGNRVETSMVSGSDDGILLCEAQHAAIEANDVFGNYRFAVSLSCGGGSSHNLVARNILRENGLPTGDGGGVAIYAGDDNQVLDNAISGNWDGVLLSATYQTVVRGNTVNGNLSVGIAISAPSEGNTVEDNIAYSNGLFDLSEPGAAGANTWTANLFDTSDF